MILKETSFDRFIFTCTGCDHVWDVDYDVQHVEDGHGHERDYFFRDQLHCPDPTGLGQTVCPDCGRSAVIAHVSSSHAIPTILDQTTPVPAIPAIPAIPDTVSAPVRSTVPVLSGSF